MSALTVAAPASVRTRVVLVLLATLLMHALLLEQVHRTLIGTEGDRDEIVPLTARLLSPPAPPAPPPAGAAPRPAPRPRPPPVAAAPPAPVAAAPTPVEALPGAFGEAPAAPEPAPAAEPVAADEPVPAPVAEAEPEDFEATGTPLRAALSGLPSLRTALRGSARYVYRTTNSEIRLASGTTTVDWTLAADGRYQLRMTTVALGMTVLELDSQGSLGEFGLAPERYTETRARRSPEAANFDWAGRRVTFSARTHERPLVEGAQDRISFQIQLMLLGQARPDWFRRGARMVLPMAGRDDMTTYRFRSTGRESTPTGAGPMEAVRIERITSREAEARIEVWLVPALDWLPVRMRFTDRLGRVTESVLESQPTS